MTETSDSQPVKIEVEDENDESIEVKAEEPKTEKLTIQRKKVSELTDKERAQLIEDARNGVENEFFGVKLFKNGNSRITLKKQTKAQQLIQSNESNQSKVSAPSSKFLTDNQLLMEHIINLETQYSKLHAKHKKLKKRYNELEGYLYTDDKDDSEDEKHKPKPEVKPEPQPEPEVQQPIPQQNPYIQRRYVKSWRDVRPIQPQ